MMDRVARRTEAYQFQASLAGSRPLDAAPAALPLGLAAARATAQLATDLRVRSILVLSGGGATARMVAAMRPSAPVLVVTPNPLTWRQSVLLWGAIPILRPDAAPAALPELARELALELGLGEPGQHVLALSGFGAAGNPPTLSMLEL
jgi:pyruvate kinase